MLHIRCGDDILGKLKQAKLPGEFVRWADPLCQGPTPAEVQGDEWREIRARFASDHYGIPLEEAGKFLTDQDAALERFGDHEEVVLWFEHDLFDQIILVYLLDWFGRRSLGRTKLSMVCIDRFPGVDRFVGLGNLDSDDLRSLFPARETVTADQIGLAQSAWKAYTAPHPSELSKFMEQDISALPFLGRALTRHFQQFPSVENGLNLTERLAMEIIEKGVADPEEVFARVQERELHPWCGDTMFWWYLKELGEGENPLLHVSPAALSTTFDGSDVLAGMKDRLALQPLDRWLGGVHITPKTPWRWDNNQEKVVKG